MSRFLCKVTAHAQYDDDVLSKEQAVSKYRNYLILEED